jgi:hypothetical protein
LGQSYLWFYLSLVQVHEGLKSIVSWNWIIYSME